VSILSSTIVRDSRIARPLGSVFCSEYERNNQEQEVLSAGRYVGESRSR
jgi:hypothetical protein